MSVMSQLWSLLILLYVNLHLNIVVSYDWYSNVQYMFMPTDRKLRSRNASFSSRRFLMLRWWWGGVGWGMLTFVWTCWGSWCYADDGVGWCGVGHVNVRVNLLRFLMLRWWWGGNGVSSTRTKTWRKPRCPTARDVKMTVRTAEHAWTCLKQKLRFA